MEGIKKIIIVTGLSGSGKSTAIRAFEDAGAFCIDNMPMVLIPELVEVFDNILKNPSGEKNRTGDSTSSGIFFLPREDASGNIDVAHSPRIIVLGIDCRNQDFVNQYKAVDEILRRRGIELEILFLEARDDILVRRFSETRRPHPLAQGGDILSALRREKTLLQPLRDNAKAVIDTSYWNVHELRRQIMELMRVGETSSHKLQVTLLSFGFKFGVPLEADLMWDSRFLANPYFIPELQGFSGLDQPVNDFVMQHSDSVELAEMIEKFLRFTLPLYEKEGKAYLTAAIGCTGGRHRSVCLVKNIAAALADLSDKFTIISRHRDVGR